MSQQSDGQPHLASTSTNPAPIKSPLQCPLCDQKCVTPYGFKQHQGSQKCASQTAKKKRAASAGSQTTPATIPAHRVLPQYRPRVKVMRRIPKHARHQAGTAFANVLEQCVRENSSAAWARLLCFASEVLALPAVKEERRVSLTTTVKSNIKAFNENRSINTQQETSDKKAKKKDGFVKRQVNMRLNDGDISGAVRILSSDDSMAPFDNETMQVLQEKHPAGNLDAIYPDPPASTDGLVLATAEEIRDALRSFRNGSAAGVDHLRAQHILDMIGLTESDLSSRILQAIADLVNLMLRGEVHEEVRPVLYGASLIALRKKDGGIRPVAVGHVLRRLVGKVISHRIAGPMGNLLRPRQLGFGTQGGAEAGVHAARAFLEVPHEGVRVLLKLDFRNAFNCVNRDVLLTAVKRDLPEYYPFFWSLYRHPSNLSYGEQSISSAWGVQQGDPLGTAGFCISIDPLVKCLTSPLNVWYLDDATLGGSVENVLQDTDVVVQSADTNGLELNWGKCEAYVFGGNAKERARATSKIRLVSPLIKILQKDGVHLLGSPLTLEAIPSAIDSKRDRLSAMVCKLELLPRHQALFLLRHCFSLPKLLYVLRTCPSFLALESLRSFDSVLKSSVQTITNTQMTTEVWNQVTLPVGRGGLGIRLAEQLAVPAYLASVASVCDLVSTLSPLDLESTLRVPFEMWKSDTNLEPLPGIPSCSQKAWDSPVIDRRVASWLEQVQGDPLILARLLAIMTPEAGKWLNALPALVLGTLMENDRFCIAIQLRLGACVCIPHTCGLCGNGVDEWGLHGLSCLKNVGTTIARHNIINEVLGKALASAGAPNKLEPSGLSKVDRTRPDGMTLHTFSHGLRASWDVTCVDTLAASNVGKSSKEAGKAVSAAEHSKDLKYAHLADTCVFFPVGFETIGTWGPSAKRFVGQIGTNRRTTFARVLKTADQFRNSAWKCCRCSQHCTVPEKPK